MTWRKERSGPWIAVVGLVVVAWTTIASAFSFSPWALVLLLLLLPEAMAVDMLSRSGHKAVTMVVPVVGLALWFLGIFAGAKFFGWGG